ncbi:efflux transporter, RND family, MFP subunit [Clostridiales bacterium oral taxon 876 str. F0540]|nr:efflux transporter, RND family, MFP subunit [Clostridiales bacterium oral taxon 876 str. F0540]
MTINNCHVLIKNTGGLIMKSKLIKAIVTGVIVIAVGFGGYYGYKTYFAAKPATASAVQSIQVTAKKMNLQVTVQGTGAAYAANTKDVMPNNNGTISGLSVKVGDTVTAGQKLFTADSDQLKNAVTTAKNNVTKQSLSLASDESAEKVDDNKIAMDKLSLSDAKTQLSEANKAVSNMTVTAPIGGVITAVNNTNGDSAQGAKAVLSIVDMTSIKVKVSVDELNINNVKIGQKAQIKFDAIKNKTYEGAVETIAQTGTTSNNVTTYDVVVAVKDPSGIKLGMNANVTIAIDSKENALAVPVEAVTESNGKKYVRLADSSAGSDTDSQSSNNQQGNTKQNSTANGKQVEIKTGLETDNYIEVTEGLSEGDKLAVKLPSTSSSTNGNKNNNMGGFGGQDMMGSGRPQGGNQSGSK